MKAILDIFKLLYKNPDVQIKGLTNQSIGGEGIGGSRNNF